MYICKIIDKNFRMRSYEIVCFVIIWILVLCVPLKAQRWMSGADCQQMRHDMVAAGPFQTVSWMQAACGNDYMLKELMRMRCDALLLWSRHAFMFQVSHNGYSKYGELTSSVAYSVKFGGKMAVGLRFHYIFQHVAHEEAQHSVTFDVSLYAQVTRKLSFGFEVYNPARLKYGVRGKDLIPMRFRVVALYSYSEKLSFSLLLRKCLPGLFDVSAGCCYRPSDFFYLSLECSLYNANCGIMLRCRRVYFKIDARYNYRLGFALEVGVGVQLGLEKLGGRGSRDDG